MKEKGTEMNINYFPYMVDYMEIWEKNYEPFELYKTIVIYEIEVKTIIIPNWNGFKGN